MKLILTLFTILAFTPLRQDNMSQDILDKASKKIKESNSFYTEFNVSIKNSSSGLVSKEIARSWIKGNKYRIVFGDNTIFSDGIKNWVIVKEEKTVYISDAFEEKGTRINPGKLMTIWESGFKNKYGEETTLNEEVTHIIYLYPENPGSVDYHTIIVYITKSTDELKKVVVKMRDSTIMTYEIAKFISNPVIEDNMLIYDGDRYPGYTVIEDI